VEIGSDAVHLLGVQGKNLVASGDYLYWFDVFTGRRIAQYGPPQKDAPGYALPSPRGFGRGLVAGGNVYWPTVESEQILVFAPPNVAKNGPVNEPVETITLANRAARSGNLLLAGERLLILSATKLQALKN
jgi:hypothetical protein